jgi:hypothetical protein
MPVYAWMWVFFLLTLGGDAVANQYVTVGWYWGIPVIFFVLGLVFTLDAHDRENQ